MNTVEEMRQKVLGRAGEDHAFRQRLLAEPKAAVEEELGVRIPEPMSIVVHEEGAGTAHIVLPPDSRLGEADGRRAGGEGAAALARIAFTSATWAEPRERTALPFVRLPPRVESPACRGLCAP